MNRETFEAHVEHALAPTLQAGQVMIMDNLPAHSPDFNLIKEAFSKIADTLHEAGARTKDALGEVLSTASIQDAPSYCEHADYRLQAHPL
jgi:hypothetical protein